MVTSMADGVRAAKQSDRRVQRHSRGFHSCHEKGIATNI